MKIDPAKATPQAPRALRVGRPRAADAPPGPDDPPASENAPGTDAKPGSSMDEHEPNRAAAQAACEAAAEAYKSTEGSDSAAALLKAEEASAAAREACSAAESSSAKLRGAEPTAESTTAPMPPAPGARAIVAAAGGQTAAAHLEAAQFVALGRDVLARTGAATADAAMLKVEAGLSALAEVGKMRAASKKQDAEAMAKARHERLAAAVRAGMPRSQAFTVTAGPAGADGKPTEVLTVKPVWERGSLEQLSATLDELGFKVGASVKPGLQLPADSGDAGLAQRAKDSGMTVEARRAAEENVARSRAKENR